MAPNKQLSITYPGAHKYVRVSRNVKYNYVLQNCIVTKITSVKTEELVMKTSIINTSATVSLALPADTVKQVSSSVVL